MLQEGVKDTGIQQVLPRNGRRTVVPGLQDGCRDGIVDRLGVRPISEIVVEVGFGRRDVHPTGLRGLDGSSHLQVGLEPEAVVQLVVDQEVDQVRGHARIFEVLVGDVKYTSAVPAPSMLKPGCAGKL